MLRFDGKGRMGNLLVFLHIQIDATVKDYLTAQIEGESEVEHGYRSTT